MLALKHLKETLDGTFEKASSLEAEFQTAKRKFEIISLGINEFLRNRLVEEIDEALRKINEKIAQKENEFRIYTCLFSGKEIWIQALKLKNGEKTVVYDFNAIDMNRKTGLSVAMEMETKNPSSRYTRTDEFKRRTHAFKSLITNGKLDYALKAKGEEAIWKIMGNRGELLPALGCNIAQSE